MKDEYLDKWRDYLALAESDSESLHHRLLYVQLATFYYQRYLDAPRLFG